MRILVATPLYPPDIAEPAPYAKELARRLSNQHSVTIATYGELPEPIAKVTIRAVSKRYPSPLRLARFTLLLWRERRRADVLFIQNGPSVEFPMFLLSLIVRVPYFIRMSDLRARAHAKTHPFIGFVERAVVRAAKSEVRHPVVPDPLPRPEISPLESFPQKELDAWESSWRMHIDALVRVFTL